MNGAAIVYDDTFLLHDYPGHPENAARLRAITDRLAADPALRSLPASPAPDADVDALRAVHTERHILSVEHAARSKLLAEGKPRPRATLGATPDRGTSTASRSAARTSP